MATVLGGAALPRRLTQLFSDNKRTYEALVQTRQTAPEVSPLHLKLRIQKDRLVAWGIQWSDRRAASGDDIDGSLDRAGLSGLVESIMSSIRELLVEAETLQPQLRTLQLPQTSGKAALLAADPVVTRGDWTPTNLRRLEEIVKDLTTSIDTLCDLSRPRLDAAQETQPSSPSGKIPFKGEMTKAPAVRPVSMDINAGEKRNTSPARRDDLTDMTYIDPSMLRLRASHARSTSSPPSYESVAAGSENRVLAYFSLPSAKNGESSGASLNPSDEAAEIAVLLDYRQNLAAASKGIPRPEGARFEELLLALLKFSDWKANAYTGVLKLNGWTIDRQRTRFAYVYEIPRPIDQGRNSAPRLEPCNLMSFLQNSSDVDAANVPSLENRFKLALNLSLSLMRLHEMNLTHRNVNSSNVLFFVENKNRPRGERIWKSALIRKPYLTGFNQLASTTAIYDKDSPFSGSYFHPRLSGSAPVAYELSHDYYSLGLILLEIGLWMPIGKFWKPKYTVNDFKTRLQNIYLKKLSGKCGETFMNAVLFCMTAADTTVTASDESVSFEEEQAKNFQQNVIRALERCCSIDGESGADEIIEAFEPVQQPIDQAPEQPAAQEFQGTAEAIEASRQLEAMAPVVLPQPKTPVKKIKVWSHEIPPLYTQYWTSTMLPRLEKILRRALSRWESYTIDLFLAGEHPDTARPTIYVECASTAKVRKILRHLNKEMRLFEIRVVQGQITRSKAPKKKRVKKAKTIRTDETGNADVHDLNPCYQLKPAFGASIGAYLDGAHLPPVTFGGAVLVDGEPYGMSVHHMLEDDEEMQLALGDAIDLRRSMAHRDDDVGDSLENLHERMSNMYPFDANDREQADDVSSVGYTCSEASGTEYSPDGMPEAVYPFELEAEDEDLYDESLDETADDDEFWLRADFDNMSQYSDDDEDIDLGDKDGIAPGSSEAHLVTQPAIDDVKEGFFPCPEDADFEHLTSHTLGYVHASSGLRRTRTEAHTHEVDWALIKINTPRLHCHTALNKPPISPTGFECPRPTAILPCDALGARPVHSHARSSGLFARGTILPAMRLVRMPGRISPSHSWQIKGNFGHGGDSGAWVFDDATGAVCGHVLAYSDRSNVAYIAPMDIMVQDMERVLGKKVWLPGGTALSDMDLSVPSLESGQLKTHSPVVPTSPPVLPRYDSGQSATVESKTSNRAQWESGRMATTG